MHVASIINKGTTEVFDALGPTVEFLTSPMAPDTSYCIMKGTIPSKYSVPLHSHPDDESFYILSGSVEALVQNNFNKRWVKMGEGDFVHIPSNVRHAWRNNFDTAVEGLIVTTPRLGRFFQEIARPVLHGEHLEPTPAQLQHFMKVAARYNHWLASPEENAEVGIF
jgi:quercetin dioxygenase-like cupin family protein